MKKIKRPDFLCETGYHAWFDEHLKDKFIVDPSECVRVYGDYTEPKEAEWTCETYKNEQDTHTALLFGIEEIEKDSYEKLVNDFYNWMGGVHEVGRFHDLKLRAKKLIGESENER